MPRSPKWKKVLNYNNGGYQTKYKPPRWEQQGKMVSAPRSHKYGACPGMTDPCKQR